MRGSLAGLAYPLLRVATLLRRHWGVVLAWFLVANLTHRGAIWISAWVGVRHHLLGLVVLPSAVLVSLLTYVVMFLLLRPSLTYHRRAVAEGALSEGDGGPGTDRSFADAVALSLLPFLTFYFAWKFLREDALDYSRQALDFANETVFRAHPLDGQVAKGLSGAVFVGTAIVVYAIRLGVKKLPERGGRVVGWFRTGVTAYLECLWIFIAAYGLAGTLSPADWLKQRTLVAKLDELWQRVLDHVLGSGTTLRSGYDALAGAVHLVAADLWNAAVLPLMWLTVVAVIYGRQLGNPKPITENLPSRFSAVRDRSPSLLRVLLRSITADWRGRWVPVANAYRLVTRGGLLPFLSFVLAFAALDALCGWFYLGLRLVVGPHPLDWWQVADPPIELLVDAVRTILRVCLLAAAYDRAVGGLAGYLDAPDPATGAATGSAGRPSRTSPSVLPAGPRPAAPGTAR